MSTNPGLDSAETHTRAHLVAIVESSDDAIISKTLDGIITSWNKGAERIFGWSREEAIGKPITMIIPEDRFDEEPQILARLRAGERVDHFRTRRQTKDGRLIYISATISPVVDDAGTIVGVSKVARDITQDGLIHQQLQHAKETAERAREAAETAHRAKDDFLSVLSHELRTPLTPVLLAVELMANDSAFPAHLRDQLQMVRRNVETEARLVDDLLDLTRIAGHKVLLRPEVVDVHAMLRNLASMLAVQVEAKMQTLELSLQAKQSHVWADPGRFQQMVLNLLSNAVKFTPAGGRITLRTNGNGGSIRIEVLDTGVGIHPDVLPRLFRPFEQGEQTATRQFGGLGLGLSIVRSFAELHKAEVFGASDGPNKGSTFTLRFPTITPREPSAPPVAAAPGLRAMRRVLLVEDHDDTRQMLHMLIGGFDCEVTATASVREAIEAFSQKSFDLLISDIGLPDGTGLDVMRHIKSKSETPGIALSGFGQDEDVRQSQQAGFAAHLIKPVNVQLLCEVMNKLAG